MVLKEFFLFQQRKLKKLACGEITEFHDLSTLVELLCKIFAFLGKIHTELIDTSQDMSDLHENKADNIAVIQEE